MGHTGTPVRPSMQQNLNGHVATLQLLITAACLAHTVIDGKKMAEDIRGEIAVEVAALKAKTGKVGISLRGLGSHAVSASPGQVSYSYHPCPGEAGESQTSPRLNSQGAKHQLACMTCTIPHIDV